MSERQPDERRTEKQTIGYLEDLRFDRTLKPADQAELIRTLRGTIVGKAHEPDEEHRLYADLSIPEIVDLEILVHDYDVPEFGFTVYYEHPPEVTIQADDPACVDCSHPHTRDHSRNTVLSDLDQDLSRDILSIIAKMFGLKPTVKNINHYSVGDYSFLASSCINETIGFIHYVTIPEAILELYQENRVEVADRLDIPLEPTDLELNH